MDGTKTLQQIVKSMDDNQLKALHYFIDKAFEEGFIKGGQAEVISEIEDGTIYTMFFPY